MLTDERTGGLTHIQSRTRFACRGRDGVIDASYIGSADVIAAPVVTPYRSGGPDIERLKVKTVVALGSLLHMDSLSKAHVSRVQAARRSAAWPRTGPCTASSGRRTGRRSPAPCPFTAPNSQAAVRDNATSRAYTSSIVLPTKPRER